MKKRDKILTAILLSAAMTLGSMSTGMAAEANVSDNASGTVSESFEVKGDTYEGIEGNGPEASGGEKEASENNEASENDAPAISYASGENTDEQVKASGENADEQVKEDAGSASDDEGEKAASPSSDTVLQDEEGEEDGAPLKAEEESVSGDAAEDGGSLSSDEALPEEENSLNEEAAASLGRTQISDVRVNEDSTVSYTVHEYTHEYDGKPFSPMNYTVPDGSILVEEILSTNNVVSYNIIARAKEKVTMRPIKDVSQNYTFYRYPSDAEGKKFVDTIKQEGFRVTIKARPITFRSATYTKEFDGKPLSQNSASGKKDPEVVEGSMVQNQKFKFVFTGVNDGTPDTSVKNVFHVETSTGTNAADTRNYDTKYEYGNLVITASRNRINNLPRADKATGVFQKNGTIKLSWKKVKSYKSNGKKGGKTTYYIYRYSDNDTWKRIGETTKNKFMDSDPATGERLIYKLIPYGYDSSGTEGEAETPTYIHVTPKIISVAPADGIHYANVSFMGFGTLNDSYTVEHWNVKNKDSRDRITVNKYNTQTSSHEWTKRKISSNSYLDPGGERVTISGNNKATFSFRVQSNETTVYDYGQTVDIKESPWSKAVKLKMISLSPTLRGERETNTSFKLKWTSVKKANGYLIEYCKNKDFKGDSLRTVYCSPKEKSSTYEDREYIADIGSIGVPYYCRVTSYTKKKGDGSTYGVALGTSNVVVQYGRQKKVEDLEAEFFDDGNYKCDAKLTWKYSDDVKLDSHGVYGYYIQRWSYEYNKATKKYDKETGHEVLQKYTISGNEKRRKYANTVGSKIENGQLIKYRVQSVIFVGGTLGEYGDGYIFSDPADYYYMNPSELKFKSKKYTAKIGETTKTYVKFKSTEAEAVYDGSELKINNKVKPVDGLTSKEFKECFCYNSKLEFVLQSDAKTNKEIKEIVTVDASDGRLKGYKEYSGSSIKLKVSSLNDPSNVYGETTVVVAKSDDSSDSSSKKSSSGSVKVCIDPGHGGKDDGATGNGLTEKDINLTIAKKVGGYLKDEGVKVVYTRESDKYVSLTDRTDYAEDEDCDYFISIHCNSNSSSGEKGTEVYYSVKSDYAKPGLAKDISKAVSDALGTDNRGAKTRTGDNGDYYSVIRTAAAKGIPGLIVEHAFVSNSSDAEKLNNGDLIDKMAKAEAKAIAKKIK